MLCALGLAEVGLEGIAVTLWNVDTRARPFLPHDTYESEVTHVKESESVHSRPANPLGLSCIGTNYPPRLTVGWIYDHAPTNAEAFFGARATAHQ